MMELGDKDFKAAIINMLNGTKKDVLVINFKKMKLQQRNKKYKKKTKQKKEEPNGNLITLN